MSRKQTLKLLTSILPFSPIRRELGAARKLMAGSGEPAPFTFLSLKSAHLKGILPSVPVAGRRAPGKALDIEIANCIWESVLKEGSLPSIPSPPNGKPNRYAGKAIEIENGELAVMSSEEVREAVVIFVSGLGGGSREHRIRKNAENTVRGVFGQGTCATYIPPNESDDGASERYDLGMKVYFDEHFIDEEASKHFFETILAPKFLDEAGALLPAQECQRLLLFSHSIAVRESISHMRYFVKYLEEEGLTSENIKEYTDQIFCLNIASPVPLTEDSNLPRSVSFVSMTDSGSARSEDYFRRISLNPACYAGIRIWANGEGQSICTLPPGVVLNFIMTDSEGGDKFEEVDEWGHSSICYAHGLKVEELDPIMKACRSFADPEVAIGSAVAEIDQALSGADPVPSSISWEDSQEALEVLQESLLRAFFRSRVAGIIRANGEVEYRRTRPETSVGASSGPEASGIIQASKIVDPLPSQIK
jgi:hypothetical protein